MAATLSLLLTLLLAQLEWWQPSSALVVGGGFPSPPEFAVGTHTVRIDDGSYIRGYKRFVSGRPVWHYLGIPYAKPPVGPLRFRAPRPPDSPVGGTFDRPLDMFHKPRSCYFWPMAASEYEKVNGALMMWWNNTAMSEDCLYLNVWTPTVSTEDKKAVMVWIFGGGFYGGSASLEVYDGAVLSSKGDVIVASMQYRTGALGFMHLDDDESPGNMGLMDQQMALKWLWTNINKFGGDPTRITLFGESAGGVSVSYHMLSPGSKGYFSRAIMNSGTALAWWACDDRAEGRAKAEHLARQVGCFVDPGNRKRTIECMRYVSVERIQDNIVNTLYWMNEKRTAEYYKFRKHIKPGQESQSPFLFFEVPFKPVYSTEFIPDQPQIAMYKGNIKKGDVLLGVVKDEGVFWIMYALYNKMLRKNKWFLPLWWNNPIPGRPEASEDFQKLKSIMDEDPFDLVSLNFLTTQHLHGLLTEAVAFEYQVPSRRYGFNSWRAEEVINAFDDITGDKTFKCPVIDFADMYVNILDRTASRENNVWLYSFEHRTENIPLPKWTGTMHGYELDYVFGMPFNHNFTSKFFTYTRSEELLSEDIIKFWSNFAKTGNPNQPDGTRNIQEQIVRWPPYQASNRSNIVLEVKSGYNYRLGENLRRRKCNFWRYQMSRVRHYLRRNDAPCPTEPKKSTQGRSGASLTGPANVAMLLGLLSVCLVVASTEGSLV